MMAKIAQLRSFAALLVAISLAVPASSPTAAHAATGGLSDLDLASYWAPVWMQDTDSSYERADYITRFDYDADWRGDNNWNNLNSFSLPAYIYYAVFETRSHYFLHYADFHPRDWSELCTTLHCHENDMEGVMLVIKKNGTRFGAFQLMITVAHLDFYSYKDYQSSLSAAVTAGHETIDGDVQFHLGHHPYVYVEAKGHGVYGSKRWERNGFPGGDGVVYYVGSVAQAPSHGNDRSVTYRLRSMNELWHRRYDFSQTFASFGVFRGNTYKDNAAHAPWRWDDHDDGAVYQGDMYFEPSYLVDYYHNGLGWFSHLFVYSSDGVIR
jgi:hypothetical protein